jgi:hypothetical protein
MLIILSIILFSWFEVGYSQEKPFPIQFGIPEVKIVHKIPEKTRDFAYIIPGDLKTYIYTEELDYYRGYQQAYFAVTCKKGGWDCMRHYEILANGCIPYFIDLDKCDDDTMVFLPKSLIKEAMNLPGVSFLKIDFDKFDKKKYNEILIKLLNYTRRYLTTKAMAMYLLRQINYSRSGTILYLSNDPEPDYMRCCMLIGLKELLSGKVIDVPKIEHVYKSYSKDVKNLYGKGLSYTKIIDDIQINRENIEDRIKNKEFELIIYGSVHRGLRYHDLVKACYSQEKIYYICGEDQHRCEFTHAPQYNLFLREFEGN